MNQPNPGWYQQPPVQQPYGQQLYQQYGYPPPPGYGRPPGHSTTMAYVSALLFVPAVIYSYIAAIVAWDGVTVDNVYVTVSTIGLAFSDDVTGNVDFAIATTMTVASTVATFLVVLGFRIGFMRWVLAAIAGIVVVYYLYAIIDLLASGGGSYVGLPILALLLWVAPLVVVVLPAVGRAMRHSGRGPAVAQGYRY